MTDETWKYNATPPDNLVEEIVRSYLDPLLTRLRNYLKRLPDECTHARGNSVLSDIEKHIIKRQQDILDAVQAFDTYMKKYQATGQFRSWIIVNRNMVAPKFLMDFLDECFDLIYVLINDERTNKRLLPADIDRSENHTGVRNWIHRKGRSRKEEMNQSQAHPVDTLR